MTYDEARAECDRLIQAQGTDTRTVSQYRVVCTTNNPSNLSSGWVVIGRPFGRHLDEFTAAS